VQGPSHHEWHFLSHILKGHTPGGFGGTLETLRPGFQEPSYVNTITDAETV